MIQFAQPIFLWALTALAIPIGIHLLSRKEGQVLKMGSLRHLRETSTQQFKGIKLNEILLLALRCLLITLFVGMLAGFHWKDKGAKRWVLVEHGLENQQQVKTITDSLISDGYEWRWLQSGFPLQEQVSIGEVNYWKLISELQNENLSKAIVFSRSNINSFNGLRPSLPVEVSWLSVSSDPNQFVLQTLKKDDQYLIREGYSTSDKTYFETLQSNTLPDSLQVSEQKKLTIAIAHDEAHTQDLQIIKAALKAIEQTVPVNFLINDIAPSQSSASADWIIWLSDSDFPAFDSLNYLILKPQIANELISRVKPHQWIINKRLTIEQARNENLSLKLANLLLYDSALVNRAEYYDRRMLSDSLIASGAEKESGIQNASLLPQSPNQYLVIVFLLILLTERVVSYARKQ
jgi:hypothetical protein